MGTTNQVIKRIFTMLGEDSDRLDRVVDRLWRLGFLFNRSEAVRLGIKCLEEVPLATLEAYAEQLERLRPGRKKQARG